MVSNVWIQKFSLSIKHCRRISLGAYFAVGKFVYNNEFYMFIEVMTFFLEMLACSYGFRVRNFYVISVVI